MLQSLGSQRIRHDLVTEQKQYSKFIGQFWHILTPWVYLTLLLQPTQSCSLTDAVKVLYKMILSLAFWARLGALWHRFEVRTMSNSSFIILLFLFLAQDLIHDSNLVSLHYYIEIWSLEFRKSHAMPTVLSIVNRWDVDYFWHVGVWCPWNMKAILLIRYKIWCFLLYSRGYGFGLSINHYIE